MRIPAVPIGREQAAVHGHDAVFRTQAAHVDVLPFATTGPLDGDPGDVRQVGHVVIGKRRDPRQRSSPARPRHRASGRATRPAPRVPTTTISSSSPVTEAAGGAVAPPCWAWAAVAGPARPHRRAKVGRRRSFPFAWRPPPAVVWFSRMLDPGNRKHKQVARTFVSFL